jgi:hypothetical protein
MLPPRLKSTVAAGAIGLVWGLTLAGCGGSAPQGVTEPAREGLAIDVAGIDYNVYITRELNLESAPDKAYYQGPPAERNHVLFGVFLQACNERGPGSRMTSDDFAVEDSQGNEFKPIPLPKDNAFAYTARPLGPGDCLPEEGSVAELGPTAASMLLFDFPVGATENRPFELLIKGPYDYASGTRETRRVELDL